MIRPFTAMLVLLAAFAAISAREDADAYVRIAKAIEAFGAVFREVQVRYVDPVDPVELVDVGIDAMLEHLDPYSEYMVGDESEDVDMLSTGSYVGVGIVVTENEGALFISDLREGGSAASSGVRIGDRIVRVDSAWADSLDQDDLRSYTRGREGTYVTMRLVREGRLDTLTFRLERRAMELESVYTSQILPAGIGYVKLTRFTRTTREELRQSIVSLQDKTQLKGLIIDVRDNPGGLLEAAIEVTELFVPIGSKIVSTRGRSAEEVHTYVSTTQPILPDVPLAVLINENSASASEIVAGALQDLDRAVVVGSRSYGKGLVQSVIPVSTGSSALSVPSGSSFVKLTTARYFTPSGRSIQEIDYRTTSPQQDTAAYTTRGGRRVSAMRGIEPDSAVSDSSLPTALYNLQRIGIIASFATRYASRFDTLPASFSVRKPLVEDFIKYAVGQPESRRDPLFQSLSDLRRGLESGTATQGWKPAFQVLENQVERDYAAQVRSHDEVLRKLLDREIRLRFSRGAQQYRGQLLDIPSVRAAHGIISSTKYGALLAPELPSDQ